MCYQLFENNGVLKRENVSGFIKTLSQEDRKILRKNGIKIGRVKNIRPNNEILNPQYNTLSKLNCILASIEANKLGYDEGIMNDMHGFISTCNSPIYFLSKTLKLLLQQVSIVLMELLDQKQ